MKRLTLLALLALSACGGGAKAAVTTAVDSPVSHTPISTMLPQTTTTVDDGVPDEVQAAEVALGLPTLTAKRYAEMKGECDAIAAGEPEAMQRVNQALPWQLGNVVWNLLPVCKDTVSDMLDGLEGATTTTTVPPTTTLAPITTTTLPPAPIITSPPGGSVVITYEGPDTTTVESRQDTVAWFDALNPLAQELACEDGFSWEEKQAGAAKGGYTIDQPSLEWLCNLYF